MHLQLQSLNMEIPVSAQSLDLVTFRYLYNSNQDTQSWCENLIKAPSRGIFCRHCYMQNHPPPTRLWTQACRKPFCKSLPTETKWELNSENSGSYQRDATTPHPQQRFAAGMKAALPPATSSAFRLSRVLQLNEFIPHSLFICSRIHVGCRLKIYVAHMPYWQTVRLEG